MSSFLRKIKNMIFPKKEKTILILGLDNAGKTTILYELRTGKVVDTVPTIGFNVESVEWNKYDFNMWDVGGDARVRLLWAEHYETTEGIIFVIDASDEDRLTEAREEVDLLLSEELLKQVPLLIFANKQDKPQAKKKDDIVAFLGLDDVTDRKWAVIESCAVKDQSWGLTDGLHWLTDAFDGK